MIIFVPDNVTTSLYICSVGEQILFFAKFKRVSTEHLSNKGKIKVATKNSSLVTI